MGSHGPSPTSLSMVLKEPPRMSLHQEQVATNHSQPQPAILNVCSSCHSRALRQVAIFVGRPQCQRALLLLRSRRSVRLAVAGLRAHHSASVSAQLSGSAVIARALHTVRTPAGSHCPWCAAAFGPRLLRCVHACRRLPAAADAYHRRVAPPRSHVGRGPAARALLLAPPRRRRFLQCDAPPTQTSRMGHPARLLSLFIARPPAEVRPV